MSADLKDETFKASTEPTIETVLETPSSIWIDDAKNQFLKLWSVRFSLLLSIFSAVQAAIAVYDQESPWAFVFACFLGIATAISRVIRQPKLKASNGWEVPTTSSAHLED